MPSRSAFASSLATLLLLVAGCATPSIAQDADRDRAPDQPATGESGAGNAGPSEMAGAGPGESSCQSGASCACEQGGRGQVRCEAETATCDCLSCPEYPARTPTIGFDARGGDPRGNWRFRGYDLSEVAGRATFQEVLFVPSFSVTCPVELRAEKDPYLSLQLNADGSAIISHHPPELSFLVEESCLQGSPGEPNVCVDFMGCRPTACDTCECDGKARAANVATEASWSQDESSFTILSSAFEFCVEGDVLRVRDRVDRVKYELTREPEPHCAGTPAACSVNESQKACDLVMGCESQGTCSDAQKPECENLAAAAQCQSAGCTWSFSSCAGEPANRCEDLAIEDCRFTPGCSVQT